MSPLEGVWFMPSELVSVLYRIQINANRAFAFALFNTHKGN